MTYDKRFAVNVKTSQSKSGLFNFCGIFPPHPTPEPPPISPDPLHQTGDQLHPAPDQHRRTDAPEITPEKPTEPPTVYALHRLQARANAHRSGASSNRLPDTADMNALMILGSICSIAGLAFAVWVYWVSKKK